MFYWYIKAADQNDAVYLADSKKMSSNKDSRLILRLLINPARVHIKFFIETNTEYALKKLKLQYVSYDLHESSHRTDRALNLKMFTQAILSKFLDFQYL